MENQNGVSLFVNDTNLTVQQHNAVIHRGKTLLVSAGAGSGKTSTLSKRIISRITNPDDPVEIDDFLIVTFTFPASFFACETAYLRRLGGGAFASQGNRGRC